MVLNDLKFFILLIDLINHKPKPYEPKFKLIFNKDMKQKVLSNNLIKRSVLIKGVCVLLLSTITIHIIFLSSTKYSVNYRITNEEGFTHDCQINSINEKQYYSLLDGYNEFLVEEFLNNTKITYIFGLQSETLNYIYLFYLLIGILFIVLIKIYPKNNNLEKE